MPSLDSYVSHLMDRHTFGLALKFNLHKGIEWSFIAQVAVALHC